MMILSAGFGFGLGVFVDETGRESGAEETDADDLRVSAMIRTCIFSTGRCRACHHHQKEE